MPIKLIDSTHCHLWSDALHARQLARTTGDEWDRGAYVRWALNTAWTAFENYASDVLDARGLGMRFKDVFSTALAEKAFPPVNWGEGIWQRVLALYDTRKQFTHVAADTDSEVLRPPTSVAEAAISTMREAVLALAAHAELAAPHWVEDDAGAPFSGTAGMGIGVRGYLTLETADLNDPEHIRTTYVWNDEECVHEIMPRGTAWEPLLDRLEKALNVPATAIRAYRGPTLLVERQLKSRRSN